MSEAIPARAKRSREPRLALRVLALVPAALTVVLWILTIGQDRTTGPVAAATELQPPRSVVELTAPLFHTASRDVHSAGDAAETPTGWIVLDTREEQLVYLDAEGRVSRRVGRRGPGPGELLRAVQVAWMDSAVVVADVTGTRLDLFSADGAFIRRIALASPGCTISPVRELVGGGGHVVILRLCTRASGRTTVLVEQVGLDGERVVLVERPFSDLRSGSLDPTREPVLARAGGRLFLGITPGRCVREVGADGAAELELCHPDPNPVALPDSSLVRLRALVPRVGALGASVELPTRYPPFEGIVAVRGQLAFLTPLDERARALDVVRGDRLERILLPLENTVFMGARGLLLARDELEGTAFAVLPLP